MDEKARDRLSDLHVDVKNLILRHLSIEEIARTSILCSKWKQVISCNLSLNFDQKLYNRNLKARCDTSFKSPVDEYLKFVLHVVSIHTGLLDKFVLYVPYEEEWKNNLSIVQKIVSTLPKTVTYLSVHNDAHDICPLNICDFKELTHLELDRCTLELRLSKNLFPRLTHLDLSRVFIPCNLGRVLKCIAPKLECLRVISCYGSESCNTTINVPGVTELIVHGYFRVNPGTTSKVVRSFVRRRRMPN